MKITINDIAKAANVSKSTVSKVINNWPTISDETKKRVREIMKEMNYTPNPYATQLAKQNSKTVGLFINASHKKHFEDPFFYSIIGGVENALVNDDHELNISNIDPVTDSDDFLRRYVYNNKFCGLILPVVSLSEQLIQKLNTIKIPFVLIGSTQRYEELPFVDIDNCAAGEIAAAHLIHDGNRNIAYLGGPGKENSLTSSRIEGYLKALKINNLDINEDMINRHSNDERSAYGETKKLLTNHPFIDSIICEDNYIAYGCIKALNELNLSIPKDIAIVTFNDYPLAPYLTPPLTSVHMDTFDLGYQTGLLLLKQIMHPEEAIRSQLIKPQLIIRESSISRE